MPSIHSANPDFQRIDVPSTQDVYPHPASNKTTQGIPMAFQITSPFNRRQLLLPHALVLHVNPQSLTETLNHRIERIQTYGGWVEQHWGPELTEISASGSTGAFMNIFTGTSSVLRQKTIAWDRYRDLHDLYRNNASVHSLSGSIVLQGSVMLMYDRGTYLGTFRSFGVDETDDAPFAFQLNWTFKVEQTLLMVSPQRGKVQTPRFQSQNTLSAARNLPSTG